MQEIRGKLKEAAALGASGQFAEMRALGDELVQGTDDVALLLAIGALLSSYGFLTDARACYEKAQTLAPTDLRAQVNLANLARDASEHGTARGLYDELLHQLPDHPVIRRNALTGLEYDPQATDAERLQHARAWVIRPSVRSTISRVK